jgi:lysophospholipase L1-like esterase
MKTTSLFLWILTALVGCKTNPMDETPKATAIAATPAPIQPVPNNDTTTVSYLALGDSYTIGESVPPDEAFPGQLTAGLYRMGYKVSAPKIIAQTGWTTSELISAINRAALTQKFKIVTLLIGVNNQYRNLDINTYRTEFLQLLNTALAYANGDKAHVFVLSIPDWGVTPFAEGRNRAQIAAQIDQYNAINKEITLGAGISYIDITPISRSVANDASLIAGDGLHPSGKMYGLWVEKLLPEVLKVFKK